MPAATLEQPKRVSLQTAVERRYAGYSTLRKKIATGELPAQRVGRRYFVREDDLEAMATPVVGRPSEQAAINAAIDRLVASAPRLSSAQRDRLAGVLSGGTA